LGCGVIGYGVFWLTMEHTLFNYLRETLLPLEDAWPGTIGSAAHPQAGVLVGLTDEAEPRVVLGRRAAHLSLHPGEIAFPGGKRELEDASPWQTAAREAGEEVGLTPPLSSALGRLEPLLTRTGFEVYPCVAVIPADPQLRVDPGEFDSVFLSRLDTFADKTLYRLEVMSDGARQRKVPHYQVGDDNIWGVTAAVLALLVNVAYDADLDLQRDWTQTP
jgi:8-oxo-dGTP pyrophosphatase MutT (NUDIX family)